MDFLETITCRCCDQVFFICHSCYHGQAYCQQSCRDKARKEQVRLANQIYLATIKGQKRRAAAVLAYRARQRSGLEPKGPSPSSGRSLAPGQVTGCNRSRSSAHPSPMVSWPQTAHCCLCGRLGRVFAPVDRR
jgi:hypothetical protein